MPTERFQFTQARLRALKSREKPYTVKDEGIKGLQCQIFPSGKKTVQIYRKPKGKYAPVRVRICEAGELPLAEVRKWAGKAIAELTKGINPNEKARKDAASEAVEKLSLGDAFNQYLESHNLAASTVTGYRRAVDRDLADWKNKPLTKISRPLVLERFVEIEKRSANTAQRTFQVLRATWHFANELHYSDENPLPFGQVPTGILNKQRKGWGQSSARTRKLSVDGLPAWFGAVRDLPNGPGEGHKMAAYLEMLLLTGLRRRELAYMRWEDVDMAKGFYTIRETKNKLDHTLPITRRVGEILKDRRMRCDAKAEYVINVNDPKKAIARVVKATGTEFSSHDLRRSFASFADQSGAGQYAIKAILNHISGGDVTGNHYARYDDHAELREPLQKIEDWILGKAKMQTGEVKTLKVVS